MSEGTIHALGLTEHVDDRHQTHQGGTEEHQRNEVRLLRARRLDGGIGLPLCRGLEK